MVKVFVLGLDGASWKIIDRLLDYGDLPTFSRLIEGGVRGKLSSSIPPATFPGWKCYSTGKNPGKLGIYGFLSMDFSKGRAVINNSLSAKSMEIWDYLSLLNYKVGVVNMPTTYPPKPVNGFMVSHSLLEEHNFTYPRMLERELKERFDYRIMPRVLAKVDKDRAVRECFEVTRIRFEALKYLTKQYDPDFLHMTIFETDHLQHYFWKYIDTKSKYSNVIFDFYRFIDELFGEYLKLLPKDVHVFVMSDHGFTRGRASFNMGRFLLAKGYVKLRLKYSILSALGRMGLNRENINKILHMTGLADIISKILPKKFLANVYALVPNSKGAVGVEGINLDRLIDWGRSKVIFIERERYYINKRLVKEGSKEYYSLLNELKTLLLSIKEPKSGEPLFREVLTKAEAYNGPYLDKAPDLVVILNDGFIDSQNYGEAKLWDYSMPDWNGVHDYYGIFIAYGPGIKSGLQRDARIYDLAPTILHMFGAPIPKDIDGEVLLDIFRPDSVYSKEPIYVEPDYYRKLKIKNRLKKKIRQKLLKTKPIESTQIAEKIA